MFFTPVQCMPKQQVEDATTEVQPGSSVMIVYSPTDNHCNNSRSGDNNTYILLHEDHHCDTGVLTFKPVN